jgi:hypothetical protein
MDDYLLWDVAIPILLALTGLWGAVRSVRKQLAAGTKSSYNAS